MRQQFDEGLGPKMRRPELIREVLTALQQKGYASVRAQKSSHARSRAYDVYELAPKGSEALRSGGPIVLPVPAAVRRIEQAEAEKAAQQREELEQAGVQLSAIPKKELDQGDGPILKAELNWLRRLKSSSPEKRAKLEALLSNIFEWRAAEAEQLQMAPATILPDYRAKQIAYSEIQTTEGLQSLGLRSSSVTTLAATTSRALQELGLGNESAAISAADAAAPVLILPEGVFKPAAPWQFASNHSGNTKKPWLISYERWAEQGQHLETIALNQFDAKGTPKNAVKQATIIGHLLTAFGEHGKQMDLRRLQHEAALQFTQAEWEKLDEAALVAQQDPVRSATFAKKEIVEALEPEVAAKDFKERSETEQATLTRWYSLLSFWTSLKRAGCPVMFGRPLKRQARC